MRSLFFCFVFHTRWCLQSQSFIFTDQYIALKFMFKFKLLAHDKLCFLMKCYNDPGLDTILTLWKGLCSPRCTYHLPNNKIVLNYGFSRFLIGFISSIFSEKCFQKMNEKATSIEIVPSIYFKILGWDSPSCTY